MRIHAAAPTAELDQARQALNRAEAGTPRPSLDATIAMAFELEAAQAAMAKGRDKDARAFALCGRRGRRPAHAASQACDAAGGAPAQHGSGVVKRQTRM